MSLHKWISKVLPVLLVSGGLAVATEAAALEGRPVAVVVDRR